MKKFSIILISILFLLGFTAPSMAGWWIFGQGTDEIITNFIYINQNSFEESGQKMTLFKETLKDGTARISGKASVRNAKIGAVMVSLDNKATWEKANLSDNGYFEFNFRPEIGQEYHVYIKILDTLGKTNDVDSTYKIITLSNENIYDKVIASLTSLVQAYQNEDPAAFMKYVSNNFAGDYAILDFAIRKDFNAFDYIELRPFINNISRDGAGRVYVAIQYIRKVVATKSGRVYADQGLTEFVFENNAGVFKVFSMKNPLLFGLSDAGEVATGTILNTNNNPIVLVDQYGNVDAQDFRTAIQTIENDSAINGMQTGTFTLATTGGGGSHQGYDYSAESVISGVSAMDPRTSDFYMETNMIVPGTNVGFKDLGACSLSSYDSAPTSGYSAGGMGNADTGACFALQIPGGNYAVFRVTSWTDLGGGDTTGNFEYRYW